MLLNCKGNRVFFCYFFKFMRFIIFELVRRGLFWGLRPNDNRERCKTLKSERKLRRKRVNWFRGCRISTVPPVSEHTRQTFAWWEHWKCSKDSLRTVLSRETYCCPSHTFHCLWNDFWTQSKFQWAFMTQCSQRMTSILTHFESSPSKARGGHFCRMDGWMDGWMDGRMTYFWPPFGKLFSQI